MQLVLETLFRNSDEEMLLNALNAAVSQQTKKLRASLPARMRKGFIEAQRRLREYVDDWLDSGVRADGTEAPGERNYDGAPKIRDCVAFFSILCSTRVALPPGCQYPEVHMQLPRGRPGRQSSKTVAACEATEMMMMLLLSDLRHRIAKCRYEKCGRYFLLNEKPRKEIYAHGLFCSGLHNRRASATKLMKQRRDMFNPKVIAWAADLLNRQKNRPGEDETLKSELLRELNTRIRKDPNLYGGRTLRHSGNYIEVNWITKHWEEIQAKAEEAS